MMNNKRGIILMVIGVVCLLSALGLFAYNIWQDEEASKVSKEAVDIIHKEMKNQGESSNNVLIISKMDTITVDDNKYIGTISIPTLQLELPVESDWNYPKLKISPCRYKGNIYDGSLIVMAHNYASHFGNIYSLKTGEKVIFTDIKGHMYNFVIAEINKLDGTAVKEMEKGSWDLTLFTCTYGGKQRVTVRCVRVE